HDFHPARAEGQIRAAPRRAHCRLRNRQRCDAVASLHRRSIPAPQRAPTHRDIADLFLPDKANGLIDEAAARLKMQVDSKPEELDSIDREIVRLKIEQEALKKETDPRSKERLNRPP